MRIVITEFISLDGVVQAPGGPEEDTDGGFAHGGWSHPFFDDAVGGGFDDALTKADALLFGRRTWQSMAAAWPERAGDPFADRMNAIPKHVVSATLGDDELRWNNTTRIPGDQALARIRELHETKGGDLVVMGIDPWADREVTRAIELTRARAIVHAAYPPGNADADFLCSILDHRIRHAESAGLHHPGAE